MSVSYKYLQLHTFCFHHSLCLVTVLMFNILFFQLLPNVVTFEELKLNSALSSALYSIFNSGLRVFFFLGTHLREPWQVARPACHPIGWWHLSDMKITLCASHWGSTIPVQLSPWTNCLCVFLVIKSWLLTSEYREWQFWNLFPATLWLLSSVFVYLPGRRQANRWFNHWKGTKEITQ